VIELLQVGDRIETGSYRLLSRFRAATAFVRREGGVLAVVVDESQPAGPAQIVVRGCPLDTLERLQVDADSLALNGARLPIGRRTDSRLAIGEFQAGRLRRNLTAFGEALQASAPPRSVVFWPASGSAFEAAMAQRLRQGIRLLADGDWESAGRAVAGLGFGLTPSGDDFLAGFLLGMYASGAPLHERHRLYQAARGSNVFSESMLRCAVDGCCIEPARALVQALFVGSEEEVARHTARLSRVGASSGADLAAGIREFLGFQLPGLIPSPFGRTAVTGCQLCGAEAHVRAGPPGPALQEAYKLSITEQAGGGVGRGPGVHPTNASGRELQATFSRQSLPTTGAIP
jgi:hypothetical protein